MKKALVLFIFFVTLVGFKNSMYFDLDKYNKMSKSKYDIALHVVKNENFFNKRYAIMIDMSLPSYEKRLTVLDLERHKTVYKTWVAHGRGSGTGAYATKFSDEEGSFCSSLGMYIIKETYEGKHGKSYRLEGLERTNGHAYQRAIVIHSAEYVNAELANNKKRIGNSHGCPAISEQALEEMQPYLQQGNLLWIYN